MWNIGLGDEHDAGRDFVEHRAKQFHNAMRLRKVDAVRAKFLPQIRDSVQANYLRALFHVEKQQPDDCQENLGVLVVEVYLVGDERRLNVMDAVYGLHW